jgi:predicted O-methyltransferase YrrM
VLEIDGIRILTGAFQAGDPDDGYLIIKPRPLVERYLGFIDALRPRTVVELGIREGGSTALLVLASGADVVVALDLEPHEPPALAHFSERGLAAERLVTRYGVDQGDRELVRSTVADALGGAPIDLVIDDASHQYGPSRASFETLFPLMRPGGLYIVEDWAADLQIAGRVARHVDPHDPSFARREHLVRTLVYRLNQPGYVVPEALESRLRAVDLSAAAIDDDRDPASQFSAVMKWIVDTASLVDLADLAEGLGSPGTDPSPPMPDLGVELVVLAASRRDLVAEVVVDDCAIVARRGPAEIDATAFRIDQHLSDPYRYLRS